MEDMHLVVICDSSNVLSRSLSDLEPESEGRD